MASRSSSTRRVRSDNILSTTWDPTPTPGQFGILPFVAGTARRHGRGRSIISTPLSVGLAIFMAEIAPRWAKNIAQPAMEVFVGIPSVVWGWLGITILVPFLRKNFSWAGFHLGFSWFAGSLVLSLMILPTITSISYDVIATRAAGHAHGFARAGLDALADDPPRRPARGDDRASSRPSCWA